MIDIEDHGPIRELRLARPPVNALSAALLARLEVCLEAAVADGARAIVLSGRPGVFSAGLDLREVLGPDPDSLVRLVKAFYRVQERLARLPIPAVIAITGHCPAGGTVMATLCDYRVMAAGPFQLGLNEVQIGLYPGSTVYRVFERLVGTAQAAVLLTAGRMLEPLAAQRVGLVDEVVEAGQVVARALEYARELAALPPQAFARTRALVRRDLVKLFDEPEESLESLVQAGWVTDETRERLARVAGSQSDSRA
jgi:3,2-trans-enoyl-CoA isomerase